MALGSALTLLVACNEPYDASPVDSEAEFRVEEDADADEEAPPPTNCGGKLLGPFLVLSWRGDAAETEALFEDDGELRLHVENTAEQPISVEVHIELHDNGVRRQEHLGDESLGPATHTELVLDHLEWGKAASSLSFSGQLTAWANVIVDEVIVETSFAEPRWFHRLPDAALVVYDRNTRDAKYGKGDVEQVLEPGLLANPNVRSIEFHDEAAQQVAEAAQ